jgi:phosphotransferase system  glucose/maltose/N-acetylglucosamine-specific IIC component
MERIGSFSDFVMMYVNGFKNLTWGKTLWIIILVKLFIMFAILRVFFFPNFLNRFNTEDEKIEYVTKELTKTPIINNVKNHSK